MQIQLPKSFPKGRGLSALGMTRSGPGPQGGARRIGVGPSSAGSTVIAPVVTTPLVATATQTVYRRPPRGVSPSPQPSGGAYSAQQQSSQMPDAPDFAPFSAALEQAGALGLVTPTQAAAYQAQAEQSTIGQLQNLTGQLNTLVATNGASATGLNGFPSRRRGLGAFPRPRRRGMGVGTAVGEAAGSAILSAAAATGPAAPFVAAAGALVSLISSFIGGGCGAACVDSAQAEQIYEYACQCLDAVAAAGQISQAALQAGLETFLQAGTQHMQQLAQQDPSATNGLTNMTNAITSDLNAVGSYPASAPKALNLATAQSLFPGTSGWYSASAAAGAQLALAYLQSLPAAGSTASAAGTTTIAGVSVSTTTLLLGAAALALGFYFFGGD